MKEKTLDYKKDHPGVYIPPPLLYVAIFLFSVYLQILFPLDNSLFATSSARTIGWILAGMHIGFIVPAFWIFFASKNSLIPIKPATTLQTTGIFAITRNPMYLGLFLLYLGMAIFKGNWWTYILSPVVILIVQTYVIRKEEKYLRRAFNGQFDSYCKKVRRWI